MRNLQLPNSPDRVSNLRAPAFVGSHDVKQPAGRRSSCSLRRDGSPPFPLDRVAPLALGFFTEESLHRFGEGRAARLLDRCDGGGDLVLVTGLAQDALANLVANLVLHALV